MDVKVQYTEDSDSIVQMLLTPGEKKTSILLPGEKLMLTYKINKVLRNFEEYPNDIARGFNLEHTPIYFKRVGQEKYTGMVYSNSVLIQTPEPDFSMPFNVNAFTHMIFGLIFVNTVYVLFQTEEENKKGLM